MTSTRRRPGGGAHVDDVVVHHQVAAFDEFDAHLPGEKGVFEVGGVVDAGGEEDDGRIAAQRAIRGASAAQRGEQSLRIVVDGPDAVVLKQGGEDALQDFAVGQHVGDAAGDAQIVFEDGEAAVGQADQVGAADVDVDVARDAKAAHLAPEVTAAIDQFARHDAIVEDLAFVIDIFQEEVEGGDALGQAVLDLRPFARGNDAREQIVGEDALGAFLVAVDGEGDAFMEEGKISGLLTFAQLFRRQAEQGLM